MFCRNCGAVVNDGEAFCPTCSAITGGSSVENGNNTEFKTSAILIFSIIELFCISPLFGLIALILYFAKLKPEISAGNIEAAKKSKKLIKILLVIGAIFSLLSIVLIMLIVLISIPNFSGVQSRMEVRADKATAAQVGNATSMWYQEAVNTNYYEYENVEESFVRLDEVDGFDNYIDTNMIPISYGGDGAYYVTIVGEENNNPRAVVAIGPENLQSAFHIASYMSNEDSGLFDTFFETKLIENPYVTYVGGDSGIAYVEGSY